MEKMASNAKSLDEISDFVSEYIATLMGCGVHTSRVVRNSRRMAEALGVEMQLSVFHKTVIMNMRKDGLQQHSRIIENFVLPNNFRYNAELSALSWKAYDEKLSLEALREQYNSIISKAPLKQSVVTLMAGAANASFCRLFGGDWLSVLIVLCATLVGFSVKSLMHKRHVDPHVTVMVSAFVASIIASLSLLFNTTSDIAITTSVLFLIPGVPLINGVIDIVEGYILCGFARLTKAMLVILCIAVGLSFTLWMFKNSLV